MNNLIPEAPQSFVYTQLTDQQQLEGQTLSTNNKLVIQNERAKIAEQLLGLSFDPADTFKFVQEQAFLQGQLSMYKWILDAADAAEIAFLELAARLAEQDQQNPDQQSSIF